MITSRFIANDQVATDVGDSLSTTQTDGEQQLTLVETYIKVSGQRKYLYYAVDKFGDNVDFLLTAKRDLVVAPRFLERAINLHDLADEVTIDKSGANTASI